jgi:uncharacterized protein YprB with RNaseH-like and TPR domain
MNFRLSLSATYRYKNHQILTMPTLSDRLKALGVKVGATDLPPPQPRNSFPVEEIVPGRILDTKNGATFLIEEDFPDSYIHGEIGLRFHTLSRTIAEWAGDMEIAEHDPETIVFLDTETSGLAGGTGTFAFLIGAGRYTIDGFHLAQFFMRDPLEEPALLLAFEEFLANCQIIVSFNGKSFDIPLLNTRFTMQGWKSPFKNLAHIDLLHLARRLWRDRLPSRTLANIEVQILHATRTDEEIPGWMIPQLYFDYLREGDARPLKRVFYHNSMDVISLAALLNHTTSLLEDPIAQPSNEYIELAAVARLLEELGHTERAVPIYEACLKADLPQDLFNDTLCRLSFLHKHNNNYPGAVTLWVQATLHHQIYAFEELAKYYEHHTRDLELALFWTTNGIEQIDALSDLNPEKGFLKNEFQHRLQRLQRKMAA